MLRSDKFTHFLLVTTLFLVVVCIAPFFYNTAITSKLLVIGLATLCSGVIFASKLLREKKLELTAAPVISLFSLFSLSVLVSVFFTNQYPVQNLLGLGGFQLASLLLLIFGTSVLAKESQAHSIRQARVNQLIDIFLIGGALVGLTSLLQLFGVGPSRLFNALFGLNLPNTVVFNLTGSAFVAVQVAILGLVALIARAVTRKQLQLIDTISLPLLVIAIGVNVWASMPGKPAGIILPDLSASWSIAIDSLRTPRSALIGFGTDSYSDMYSRFKPLWVNGQDYWRLNFGAASNYPLTLIVTQGLFGVVTWLLLVMAMVKLFKATRPENRPIAMTVLATMGLQLVLPANLVVLGIQTIGLIYWLASQTDLFSVIQLRTQAVKGDDPYASLTDTPQNKVMPVVVGVLILIGLAFPAYSMYRVFAAFNLMYQADRAAFKNEAINVYEYQRQAVAIMPYLDSLRRQYAITNLQIAIALSNNKNLTDSDRTQITQLISQAIREAKAATILAPSNTQNWITLGEIYRNISGVAKEADQWAVNSMVSAIETDPTNPLLRIDLGQIFFDKAQYEDAANFFNQAIELKPDLAGGYFQLGRALKEVGQFENAKTLLQKSQSLVTADSEEFSVIAKGISELDAAIAASKSAQKTTTTTTPAPKINDSGLLDTNKKLATESALLNLTKTGSALDSVTEQNTKQSDDDIVNDTSSEQLR